MAEETKEKKAESPEKAGIFRKPIAKHIIFIVLLIIIGLYVYKVNLQLTHLPMLDPVTYYYPLLSVLKQSFTQYHDFYPLWNPYIMSGVPYYFDPVTVEIFSTTGLMVFLMNDVAVAMNLGYLIDVILAGIFMYWLVFELTKRHFAGFISGIILMIGLFIRAIMLGPGGTTLDAYFFMPLIFLTLLRALKSKQWLFYSVVSGSLLGLMIRGGPDLKVVSWFGFAVCFLFLFHLIGKDIKGRLIKVFLIGLILSAIGAGLVMQKLIPTMEYLDTTNKAELTFERLKTEYTSFKDISFGLIQPFDSNVFKMGYEGEGRQIGIVIFLLALYGIYANRKNKIVLSLMLTAILIILILNGPVFWVIWKFVPMFHSFRHIYRAAIVFLFAIAILAGFGVASIMSKAEAKNATKSKKFVICAAIFILIILNIYIFSYKQRWYDTQDINYNLARNYVAQNMSSMDGIFRYHDIETMGIDWGTQFMYVPHKIGNIYGYLTAWQPQYMNVYLAIANNNPAKFWGILNMKYMTSTQPVNISGFKFVEKYEKCDDCYQTKDIQKAYGPYLYENEKFLPRVYLVKNSVLIIGDGLFQIQNGQKFDARYVLMLNEKFNPANTAIIKGRQTINQYSLEELKRYSALILTQGSVVDSQSQYLLNSYVESGGIAPKSSDEFQQLFDKFNGSITAIPDDNYITHTFDKYELKLDGKYKGFVVLSEKFSTFDGWGAKADGMPVEILNADAVISAVYIDKPVQSIIFEYKPRSYVIGSYVTIVTVILLLIYFSFVIVKGVSSRKKKNGEQTTSTQ